MLRRVLNSTLAIIPCFVMTANAAIFNHDAYDTILRHYVDNQGMVDYKGIRENAISSLESYLTQLGEADMAGWPKEERLAFWINAYNAHALHLIAQRPELKKISEDFEMYNQPFKVAGLTLSLNDIRHRVLRDTVNPDNKKGPIAGVSFEKIEPRIHFSLCTGALGGPVLRNFAYTAENVSTQLAVNASDYVNSPAAIDVINSRLRLSSLFKWYKKDFDSLGGVPAYISRLLNADKRPEADALRRMLGTDYPKKTDFSYEWTINRQ